MIENIYMQGHKEGIYIKIHIKTRLARWEQEKPNI
jgi:hypothetical protein